MGAGLEEGFLFLKAGISCNCEDQRVLDFAFDTLLLLLLLQLMELVVVVVAVEVVVEAGLEVLLLAPGCSLDLLQEPCTLLPALFDDVVEEEEVEFCLTGAGLARFE